jgi:hypothetical protein
MPDAYTRVVSYEMAKGVDFKLENLATADPANYELRNSIVFRKGAQQATRFFIVGCVTQRSALHERVVNGRRSINVMPSIFGWGRASGVIHTIFGTDINAYTFGDGLSFSTTMEKRSSK